MKSLQDVLSSQIIDFLLKLFPKKPFKIGIISYYYPALEGGWCISGVGIYTHFVSRELAKHGCNVHVFTSSEKKSGVSKHNIGKGSLTVHRISTFSKSVEKNPVVRKRIKFLDFENKIPKRISKENKKGKFDIINTNGWLTSGAFTAKEFLDIKWVHTFHAVEVKRESMMADEEKKYIRLYEWVERTTKNADYFIAVSEALKHEIGRTYNIPSNKISVIPNGVDINTFRPKKPSSRKRCDVDKNKIIMTVSRFSKEKGIETLLETIPVVLDKDDSTAFLLVLPERKNYETETYTELKEKLRRLTDEYKARIKLISRPVSQKTLSKFYNMTDLYIQPSLYESFGITILEAMACGKAVVASDCGGISEIVFDGYNGLLVKPGEAKKLADATLKILNDSGLKKEMEKNSIKIAQKYSWELVGKRTLGLYEKILQS